MTKIHARGVSFLFLILVIAGILRCQTASYKDVAVIINRNSTISDSIGTYFVSQRYIPALNIIRISVPVTEEIDSNQFQDLRRQVEAYLTENHIADSINYLVTTKGVPLKIKRTDLMEAASVESELSLILGPYADNIQRYGVLYSPYYLQRDDFTRTRYGIYLVTRLDGYSFADITRIIDQSAGSAISPPAAGKFVLDQDPTRSGGYQNLNDNMKISATLLSARGLSVMLDSTATYVTNQQNVLGYTGWGSNDAHHSFHGLLNNTWLPGAIAETYVSTSARTFNAPAVYGQSLIADLIAEGITAAKGYVYEPYSSAIADVSVLFDLYTSGYTVAESFYSASPYLSWMDVIIGDPKFRLISARLPADIGEYSMPVELALFTASTEKDAVTLNWKTATETNNYGFEIERAMEKSAMSSPAETINDPVGRDDKWSKIGFVEGNGTTNAPKSYSFTDKSANGKTSYRLKQIDRDGKYTYSHIVTVTAAIEPKEFALQQNYPNPFNPSTAINYQLSENSFTTLYVYDALGREVATLVNEVKEAGSYTVQFDGERLSSGIYFARLSSSGKTQMRKMLLMK